MPRDSRFRRDEEALSSSGQEFELLLSVAGKSLTAENAARINAILSQPLNWESVLDKALHHGLAPFLYRHLGERAEAVIPAGIRERLRQIYSDNARRNFVQAGKLCEIVALLARHGIPAIAFKGPALSLAAYGDLAFRTSFDLDILVRHEDILRVKELLLSHGFEPEFNGMTPRQKDSYLKGQCEFNFNRDADLIHLEVQTAITPRYFALPVDVSGIWQASHSVRFGEQQILVPPPEEGLLLLCIHGAKHLWERLLLVSDVAELLRACPDLDWQRTLALAERSGSRRILSLGVYLAREWLGAPLPEDMIEKLSTDRTPSMLAGKLRTDLERCCSRITEPTAKYFRFQLGVRENWRDRLRFIGRLVFEPGPGDWQRLPLPDNLFALYYLLRPARLAARAAGYILFFIIRNHGSSI